MPEIVATPIIALTIAGSDPSGGAGLQADLKTFHRFGVYGTSVVTLLTVQSTLSVREVHVMKKTLVRAQIDCLLEDVPPHAAKTGALGNAEVIEAVADTPWACPLVVDPVMISKHGASLLDESARDALVRKLLPRATLLTPNVPEAEALSGLTIRGVEDATEAARIIADLGPRAVLLKGGHLAGDRAIDVLYADGVVTTFDTARVITKAGHGTGCSLSAAITAGLARGLPLHDAVRRAKAWLTEALRTAPSIGHGIAPVNHFADPDACDTNAQRDGTHRA
jgi:hydroxymethylpyrimidine/phosphomethylpyrimidine kinase